VLLVVLTSRNTFLLHLGKCAIFSKIMKQVTREAEECFPLIFIICHIFFYTLIRRHVDNV
jgi:hypothetical protein